MVLVLYGAGGIGADVLEIARHANARSHIFDDIVFAMDNPDKQYYCKIKVLDIEDVFKNYSIESTQFSICIGEPVHRARMWERVKSKGYKVATLVHPEVDVPETTTIGEGCQIYRGCYIGSNAEIGDNTVLILAAIGHDNIVGKHCVLASRSTLTGKCSMGDESFLGAGSIVIQGVSIGKRSVVGMASAVFKDIPDDVIALGNPARVIRRNEDRNIFK